MNGESDIQSWYHNTPQGKILKDFIQSSLVQLMCLTTADTCLQIGRMGDWLGCLKCSQNVLLTDERCWQATIQASYHQLPVDNDSVDRVLLPHTLEHCISPLHLLKEVHRVLVPGGQLICLGLNPMGVVSFLDRWVVSQLLPASNRCCVFHHKRLIRQVGFDEIKIQFIGFNLTHWHQNHRMRCLMECVATKLYAGLSSLYFSVSEKKVLPITPQKFSWTSKIQNEDHGLVKA